MKKRYASRSSVFITTFASMVCHPISLFIFLLLAMHGRLPWHIFVVGALIFSLKERLYWKELQQIPVMKLCIKCWVKLF